MMECPGRVAVVVPAFNRKAQTARFLESFRHVTYDPFQLIVVDDGSSDGTSAMIANRFADVVVLHGDGTLWWSGATNVGVRYALRERFDYVLTINDDTEVRPDFLERLVATAVAHPFTLVGSRINVLQEPTVVWANGGFMDWQRGDVLNVHDHYRDEAVVLQERPNPFEVDILTGCGTLIPTDCFRQVGLYDTRFCPQYHGDSELVLRAARSGYRAVVAQDAVVFNDVTSTGRVEDLRGLLLSRHSLHYWRPVVKIHLAYCPPRQLPFALAARYGRLVLNGPRAERIKRWVLGRLGGGTMMPLAARAGTRARSTCPARSAAARASSSGDTRRRTGSTKSRSARHGGRGSSRG